ncbi:hypothetical protein ACWGQ5_14375 [Streptomyces sp. NPDC055722]
MLTINVAVLLAVIVFVRLRRRTESRSRFDEKLTVVIVLALGVLIAPTPAGPAARAEAYCACRAEGCHTHLPDTGRHARAEPWRCGGPVVLAVITDREGRWWQALECCSRCAAATPGAKTAATSQEAPGRQLSERPAPAARARARRSSPTTRLRPKRGCRLPAPHPCGADHHR